ncbi:hypothetical protein PCANC_16319 [Puccinia coronata f. sp. avenae]|uniref:CxC1-like cysteine cluster associated with KDZ transposases domain-containing protein n=1 Tax=Puccinia coronata f. sp. avenae TaxID=200324 RepID=A0A2N5SK37_9BASI|nr:hypothetical protein PCANC_16319 [Puccinia coronata f. sp. avenae]
MVLERLQQLSQGMDPRMLIEPTIETAGTRREQHDKETQQSLQDENYGNQLDNTVDNEDGNIQLNIIEEAQAYHTEMNQKERQNRTHTQWEDVLPALHGAYLLLKTHTKNWTLPNSFSDHTSLFCDCNDSSFRTVDLIDLNGQCRKQIRFCSCTSDLLHLLGHGYLGSSPVAPTTAFSFNLLGFHNHLWNWCTIAYHPLMQAMRSWLEERSPPLLTASGKSRDFRTNFSATVDIYCNLLNRTESMANEVLELTRQERLARDTCPACFGKSIDAADTESPLIICLDGNFQQRHHAAASKNYHPLMTPSKFVQPEAVAAMDSTIELHEHLNHVRPTSDKCAEAHKAADDTRNQSTWKASDDTGLMGCCCRHDAVVSLANISGGGEKRKYPLAILNQIISSVEPGRGIRVLYDIGCTLKKFILLRDMFREERDCLTFGTSVFHLYVHNWKCQIEFSPRFNEGWGLSDGEGLERLWSFLSPLISSLWYSTRNHRLAALAHKVDFHNTRGIHQIVQWLRQKHRIASAKQLDAEKTLGSLIVLRNPFDVNEGMYTPDFFKSQWTDQVNFQKDQEATLTRLRSELNNMVDLFNPSSYNRILEMVHEFATAEERQRAIATNLGGVPMHLTGPNDEERNARLLVWHAKSRLYVHAVELHAERQPLSRGTPVGTTLTTRILAAMDRRKKPIQTSLKKFNIYRTDYLTRFAPNCLTLPENQPLTYHTFSNLSLDHAFWQVVYLYHSQAPWALSADVRKGIQAVLVMDRTAEEFVMIRQELNNVMSWAVNHHQKICERIDNIELRRDAAVNDIDGTNEWLPDIKLGDIDNTTKMQLVLPILVKYKARHEALMINWALDVVELWDQIHEGDNREHSWFNLMDCIADQHVRRDEPAGRDEEPVRREGDDNVGADDAGEELEPADVLSMLDLEAGVVDIAG